MLLKSRISCNAGAHYTCEADRMSVRVANVRGQGSASLLYGYMDAMLLFSANLKLVDPNRAACTVRTPPRWPAGQGREERNGKHSLLGVSNVDLRQA